MLPIIVRNITSSQLWIMLTKQGYRWLKVRREPLKEMVAASSLPPKEALLQPLSSSKRASSPRTHLLLCREDLKLGPAAANSEQDAGS